MVKDESKIENEESDSKLAEQLNSLKSFMKEIFCEDDDNECKWKDLVQLKKPGGKDIRSYFINNKSQYFSEKNFSLGELCLLRLGEKVIQSKEGSLILIEEIDMALHSAIQLKFYDKLKEVADEKKHTILFSSHSSSLIKRAFREDRKDQKVIFLQRESADEVDVIKGNRLSVAHVLENITSKDDEFICNFIYLVEDEEATYLLEKLIEKYNKLNESNTIDHFIILPFGGWPEMFRRCKKFEEIKQEHIRMYVFLDEDAKDRDKDKREELNAKFLPITPDKGLVGFLRTQSVATLQKFGLSKSQEIKNIIQKDEEYEKISCDKKKFKYIVKKIAGEGTGEDKKKSVKLNLYESYANHYAENNPSELCKLLRPQKS